MKLEFPNKYHKENYEKMIVSWGKIENLSEMSPGALFKGKNYEEFGEITNEYRTNGRSGVNSDLYFIIDNTKNIVGAIQLRHTIGNPILKEIGGHIGYGIAPEFRKKGYANEALKLLLIKAKEIGIDKILITANTNNIGSIKIIEKNGGIFDRISNKEEFKEYGIFNRYWITL